MPDIIEEYPPAVDQTGNLTLYWALLAALADPTKPKVTEAAGWTRITYSFLPDGYNLTEDQEILKDERLTGKQKLESLGTSEAALELKYVQSEDPDSAAQVLKEGLTGYIVERAGIPNSTQEAAKQEVLPIKVQLGKQRRGPRDGQGKFTILQKVSILSEIGVPVPLVAGA
ncbi:hypothetical protein M2390_002926 [Mycetocola sp. BIGb0189]|uniref:phage tail tube protein n=1 Tax=Mycetocola sp. BIGb0189 TaxID=2940604 RepID=UPI0021688AC5|nr:hypothetical protein [Mycetocola sp. BIGb0189]MCS4277717.1 hypothetical protein [Mycetocola sp. BIGb0189]